MILLNNKRLSRYTLLIQPADPNYHLPCLVARVWRFDSAIKARLFAQIEGVLVPDHNLVVRFVGSVEAELSGSLNLIDQIDSFMRAAAEWLTVNGAKVRS